VPRTLVISDLHIGLRHGTDVVRRPQVLDALTAHLRDGGFERLVLLGDTIELRHGPQRDALADAAPVLQALGAAVGHVVLLPGNHDHELIAPWLDRRREAADPPPLKLDERVPRTSTHALGAIAKMLAPATLEVRYPGVWLRKDVYATHGHYLDCCLTMPTVERIAVGVMARVIGELPERGATPDDFEAQLAPLYAWTHAVVQTRGGAWSARGQSTSKGVWSTLNARGRRPLRARALAALFPAAVWSINRAGLGPVRPYVSGRELRQAGLRAINDVIRRLDVDAEHVLFGHTHRAGPLPADHAHEWQTLTGARLHNSGCWTHEPIFAGGDPDSPYDAGRAIELDDDGPPRLVRVTQVPG
jgi:hypothetical protein